MLCQETSSDEALNKFKNVITNGWPDSRDKLEQCILHQGQCSYDPNETKTYAHEMEWGKKSRTCATHVPHVPMRPSSPVPTLPWQMVSQDVFQTAFFCTDLK